MASATPTIALPSGLIQSVDVPVGLGLPPAVGETDIVGAASAIIGRHVLPRHSSGTPVASHRRHHEAIAQDQPVVDAQWREKHVDPSVAEAKKKVKQFEAELKKLKAAGPKRETAMAVRDDDQIADAQIRIRGIEKQRGEKVPRGFLQVALHLRRDARREAVFPKWRRRSMIAVAREQLTKRKPDTRLQGPWHSD